MTFAENVEAAYKNRIALFAQGYYRTPEIHFDPKTATGKPFHYFAYGAAVSEVEVDGFTGEYRTLRTDILHDVGDSVSPAIDRGQIEGGFVQGAGWLTLEELLWDAEGRVSTAGASTYKLPSWPEMPPVFNVEFLERATEPGVVFGSKAVGEPPLMLAFSVREAIRAAIAAFGAGREARRPPIAAPNDIETPHDPPQLATPLRANLTNVVVALNSPATPECVFRAIRAVRGEDV
jgi:xanthine dehydrogenase large subunit